MNDETRNKIVKLVLEQLKKEYIHGDNGPDTFDCAGLVWYVYHEVLGINVYKEGYGQSTTGRIMTNPIGNLVYFDDEEKDLSLIKPGDVLLFHRQSKDDIIPRPSNKYPGHCGIYIGNKEFIHATIRKPDIKKFLGNEYEKYKDKIKGMVIKSTLEENKFWIKKLVASKNMID